MIQDIIFKQDDYTIENNSYDDTYSNQINNDAYLSSNENVENTNDFFESEFKKVFNDRDAFAFGHMKKEEEKEKEYDKEKIEQIRKNKKRIFKLIYNAKKFINKRTNLKAKKYFLITSKNKYENYSFDEIILYIKQLNKTSKSCSSIVNKFNLLNLEHKLILELKNRLLNKYEEK